MTVLCLIRVWGKGEGHALISLTHDIPQNIIKDFYTEIITFSWRGKLVGSGRGPEELSS